MNFYIQTKRQSDSDWIDCDPMTCPLRSLDIGDQARFPVASSIKVRSRCNTLNKSGRGFRTSKCRQHITVTRTK